jgi:hypothetical protein
MNGKLRMKPNKLAESFGLHAVKLHNGKAIIFDDILTKIDIASGVVSHTPGEIVLKLAKDKIVSRFDSFRDGIHFRCYSERRPQAVVELIFKRESTRNDIGPFVKKITAAIAAVMVFSAEKQPCDFGKAQKWVRSAYKRFFKGSCKHGPFVYSGVNSDGIKSNYRVQNGFTLYVKQCRAEIESLAKLNIAEALNRIKKDFSLLVDSLTEDDIMQMWRSAIVSKVHES